MSIMANTTQPRISVIVAVYQAEDYLRRCLDSIVNQTFLDWECIVVDDGSTDRSGDICDEYAANDSRLKVIHQANQGVSVTRQVGLDAARGEYVIHADPDDWVEPDWLEKLYNKITDDDTDMVICDLERITAKRIVYVPGCASSMDNTDLLIGLVQEDYWGVLVNKLIRRECFLRYQVAFHPEMTCMEDIYICSKLLSFPITFSYLPESLYHYDTVVNKNSLLKTDNDKNIWSRMMYINTFSPILSDSKFDEGWYKKKKNVKMRLFGLQGHSVYNLKEVYPEINDRLMGELKQSRWWSRNRCIVMCLRGHEKMGYFLYNILTKLVNLLDRF